MPQHSLLARRKIIGGQGGRQQLNRPIRRPGYRDYWDESSRNTCLRMQFRRNPGPVGALRNRIPFHLICSPSIRKEERPLWITFRRQPVDNSWSGQDMENMETMGFPPSRLEPRGRECGDGPRDGGSDRNHPGSIFGTVPEPGRPAFIEFPWVLDGCPALEPYHRKNRSRGT